MNTAKSKINTTNANASKIPTSRQPVNNTQQPSSQLQINGSSLKSTQSKTVVTTSVKKVTPSRNVNEGVKQNSFNKLPAAEKVVNEQQNTANQQIIKQEGIVELNYNSMKDQNNLVFYKIFKDNVIQQILSYLEFKSLFKFATLNKQSRFNVSIFLKSINPSQECAKMSDAKQKNEKEYNLIKQLHEIQFKLLDLCKKDGVPIQKKINNYAKEDIPAKEDITKVLQEGLNILLNTTKSAVETLRYLKEKGLFETFVQIISTDYLKPLNNLKIKTSDDYYFDYEIIHKVAIVIQNYSKIRKDIKGTPSVQKHMWRLVKRTRFYDSIEIEGIACFSNDQNVLQYLNKNIIQKIIQYQSIQEICNMMKSNKQLRSIIVEGLLSYVELCKLKRGQILKDLNLKEEQSQAIIYLLHYKWYESKHSGIVRLSQLQEKQIGDSFSVLLRLFDQDEATINSILNNKTYKISTYTDHSLNKINRTKVNVVVDYFKQYTDQQLEMNSYSSSSSLSPTSSSQDILYLYTYLKGVLQFLNTNMTFEDYNKLSEVYLDKLQDIDKSIYSYQKLARSQKETLLIYHKQFKPFKVLMTKLAPLTIFPYY